MSSDSSTPASPTSKFNQYLGYLWPIHRHELPKFLLTTALMFCILFIQNLIRAMKDSIVNTMIGTETVSFLKVWGVMPAAFAMAIIYVSLISRLKSEHVFYIIISSFLAFFAFFGFVLYPNHELFHFGSEHTEILKNSYPHFKWFIMLLSKWGFSLFYVIAELWPNAVFAILFWQFVNNVTTIEESKRFYTMFGLLGQTGLYISGKYLELLPNLSTWLISSYSLDSDRTTISVQLVLTVVLCLGVAAIYVFYYLNRYILQGVKLNYKAKASKMSLYESLKMVADSRYIRLIAILLICYGVAINLVEMPWKKQLAVLYPDPADNMAYIGSYLKYTGIFTIAFVLIGSNIVRYLGWYVAAIITPMIVFITGGLFFSSSLFDLFGLFGMALGSPIAIAVTAGAIQNVLSKSTKYTLFDSTKEMAYVPLPAELKTKGKAAVDSIGIKLGKSCSAFTQALIFMILPTATYQSISGLLMVIFTIICLIWLWAVRELSKEYNQAVIDAERREK